ncbi:hypothetical protein ACIQ6Y_08670 [Streptomyces sp. NPDC096205]|uniref:hypothetical protein n=1 Tax=Streptomyces sp. NPDC096205 TaxID=3366081 RepID=UPI0038252B4E
MSGSVWLPPGARLDTLPVPRRRTAPGWAAPDPIDELAGRLEDFVAAAVHPDEIAALLESDGMSDDRIRTAYGVKDSFALAEELYVRVDRRHPEPEGPVHDPWQIGLLGCLVRGVVFALPGLAYVLLPTATLPLLAAALTGWTWNQGLSHRAYAWLGLGDRAAARRCLLIGAPVGALLGTLSALAVTGVTDPAALAFATGQSLYLGAATVLLVMGRERALLAALLPMAAGAAVTPALHIPTLLRYALLLGSLLAVVTLAVCPEGRGELGERPRRTGGRPPVMGPPLPASFPYALFGLGSGILVLDTALEGAPGAVALTLSMGPAEWLLYRFRSAGLAGLRSTGTPGAFRRATALMVARCLTGYLAVLTALALAGAALWPHSPDPAGPRLTGLLLLGVVVWTGLLLQSFGAILSAAAVTCAAALAHTLLRLTGAPEWTGPAVYGVAAAVQVALVCALLGRATAHR